MATKNKAKEKGEHSEKWKRCFEAVSQNYDDSSAAAICTASVEAEGASIPAAGLVLDIETLRPVSSTLADDLQERGVAAIKIDRDWNTEEVKAKGKAKESLSESMPYMPVPPNVTSFADLHAVQDAYEAAENLQELTRDFSGLVWNIMTDPMTTDKIGALRNLVDELAMELNGGMTGEATQEMSEAATIKNQAVAAVKALSGLLENKALPESLVKQLEAVRDSLKKTWKDLEAEAGEEWGKGKGEPASEGESLTEKLAEDGGLVVSLSEADSAAGSNPDRGPLSIDVALIQPGWGNSRDNHYYSAEMLKANAKVFEGAKMYATDHRPQEKSVRTEVSRIDSIVGFTENGAPIGRVTIFDPEFAEATRNRARAKLLNTLECSILADGIAKGLVERDGRKGKAIEAITKVESVDWVTRAGAGGHALQIAEAENAAQNPNEEVVIEMQDATDPKTPVAEQDAAPQAEPAAIDEQAQPAAPAVLPKQDVQAALDKTNLPQPAKDRLLLAEYASDEAVTAAIAAETAYVKAVTGSGHPFANGASQPTSKVERLNESDVQKRLDAIDQAYGLK